jgi:hypothetical protein
LPDRWEIAGRARRPFRADQRAENAVIKHRSQVAIEGRAIEPFGDAAQKMFAPGNSHWKLRGW